MSADLVSALVTVMAVTDVVCTRHLVGGRPSWCQCLCICYGGFAGHSGGGDDGGAGSAPGCCCAILAGITLAHQNQWHVSVGGPVRVGGPVVDDEG